MKPSSQSSNDKKLQDLLYPGDPLPPKCDLYSPIKKDDNRRIIEISKLEECDDSDREEVDVVLWEDRGEKKDKLIYVFY